MLFRRAGAPIRYEECDIYWADRHLTEKQKLPESDLLKAVHVYTSDFYRKATSRGGVVDFESLDETALLGLGVLLEVVMGEVLGETGDLAFVEGEEGGGGGGKGDVSGLDEDIGAARGKTKNTPTNVASKTTASGSATTSGDERRHKKRKLTHEHNNDDEE